VVVLVEGAQADEVLAGLLQGDVLPDDLDDVGGLLDLVDESFGEKCHEGIITTKGTKKEMCLARVCPVPPLLGSSARRASESSPAPER
jgi:hypothetical protein